MLNHRYFGLLFTNLAKEKKHFAFFIVLGNDQENCHEADAFKLPMFVSK